jgi:hypothetical protein
VQYNETQTVAYQKVIPSSTGVDLGATGNRWDVFGQATDTTTLTLGVSLTLTPQASAPGSPVSGMMYMDSTPTPDELCVYDGAGWQALITGTDGNCA